MTAQKGISGWNIIFKNALKKAGGSITNLASAIAIPAATLSAWQSGEGKPWQAAVVRMRKYVNG